jgi:hypothetical protein
MSLSEANAVSDWNRRTYEGNVCELPFKTGGLLTVTAGYSTLKLGREDGTEVAISGKLVMMECSPEEAARHDAESKAAFYANGIRN